MNKTIQVRVYEIWTRYSSAVSSIRKYIEVDGIWYWQQFSPKWRKCTNQVEHLDTVGAKIQTAVGVSLYKEDMELDPSILPQ